MKIIKSKYMFVSALLVASMIGGGVVYALTSVDFATRAQSWVKAKCTDKLVTSSNTTTNNEYATTCYNYSQNQKQDADIASMKSMMGPMLYDGKGNLLGPLVSSSDRDFQFYDTKLNLIVSVNPETGSIGNSNNWTRVGLYYEDTAGYCEAVAYDLSDNKYKNIYLLKVDNVMGYVGGKYGIIKPSYFKSISIEPKTINIAYSTLPDNSECRYDWKGSRTVTQKLERVNISYSDPLPLPLQLK